MDGIVTPPETLPLTLLEALRFVRDYSTVSDIGIYSPSYTTLQSLVYEDLVRMHTVQSRGSEPSLKLELTPLGHYELARLELQSQ